MIPLPIIESYLLGSEALGKALPEQSPCHFCAPKFLQSHGRCLQFLLPQSFEVFLSNQSHSNDRLKKNDRLHFSAAKRHGLTTSPVFLDDNCRVDEVAKSVSFADLSCLLSSEISNREIQIIFILEHLKNGKIHGSTKF
jgi:hypothetical protein